VKNALPFEAKGVALANAGEFQWGTSGHAGELADSGIYVFFSELAGEIVRRASARKRGIKNKRSRARSTYRIVHVNDDV